jgi:PAS domain S-box-containing protein
MGQVTPMPPILEFAERLDLRLPRVAASPWVGYMVAAALVVSVVVLEQSAIAFQSASCLLIFLAAISCSTMVGGMGAGFVAAAMSYGAISFMFVPSPPGVPHDCVDVSSTDVFFPVALLVVMIVGTLRAGMARIRQLNDTLLSTFDANPDGMILCDPTGRIEDCNSSALAMFGYRRPEMIGARLDSLLPPLAPPDQAGALGGSHQHGSRIEPNGQARGLRADGSEFHVIVHFGPLRRDDQLLTVVTVRDITARLQARTEQEAARQHQAVLDERARNQAESRRWVDAFRNAAFGIAIVSPIDGRVELANPAFAAMHGIPVEAAQGRTLRDLCVPEERYRVPAVLASDAQATSVELFHVRSDGTRFPVRIDISAVRDAEGIARYRIVTFRDQTERRRAEEMAAAMNERFEQMFEESPIGMALLIGPKHRILRANTAVCRMLECDADELVGQRHDEFTHPADLWLTKIPTGAAACPPHPIDMRLITKLGRIVQARVRAVNLGKTEGGEDLVLSLIEDVTHQRELESALRQSQRMESVGLLAGGIAHDFNNLLGILIGNLELLKVLLTEQPQAEELVEDALAAALRGADLTGNLLAFARRRRLRPAVLDVNEVVSSLHRLLNRVLRTDIAIDLALDPDVWPVLADRAQLESGLINLASNARDAMPHGGLLRIATGTRCFGPKDVLPHPDLVPGDYVLIDVTDTGEGISQDVLAHIFDPFFTTKKPGEGTGLGLSTVFGFAKQSGGHISATSGVGEGTTFRLYLPRLVAPRVPVTQLDRTPDPLGAGERVLVVEDNEALRRVVARQLTAMGYVVEQAETGTEALERLKVSPVDLVFTDLVMPGGMDGADLADRVREAHPNVKVLLTSGFAYSRSAGDRPRPAGTMTLQKPYRRSELAHAVGAALRGETVGVAPGE